MKRFFIVFLSVIFCFSLVAPAMAAEAGEGETTSGSDVGSEPVINVYNEIVVSGDEDPGTYVGTSVYSLSPVTSADATGLKAVLLEFLGSYDAVVVEHEYESSNGYTNYVREIQLDYPWLCSAAILAIFIFCLFRLGGAILCRK